MEHRFDAYLQLNKARENAATKDDRTDFAKVAKVDTHIHLAAGATSAHLLDFIKRKLSQFPDEKVTPDATLRDLFNSAKLDPQDLSIHLLDTQASFDRFFARARLSIAPPFASHHARGAIFSLAATRSTVLT